MPVQSGETDSRAQTPTMRVARFWPTAVGLVIVALVVMGTFVIRSCVVSTANPSSDNPVAIVHAGDGQKYRLPLSRDAHIVVETDLGTNAIEVADGAIHVLDADCDGHDCIRQGWIHTPGEQLICLPHKMWIEIRTSEGESQLDPDAAANNGGHLPDGQEVDTNSR